MMLFEVPRNTRIRLCEAAVLPPGSQTVSVPGDVLLFHYIDGMYSFCETNVGEIVHLSAWQSVEIVP